MNKGMKISVIAIAVVLVLAVAAGVLSLVLPKNETAHSEKDISTMGYGSVAEPKDLSEHEKMSGYASVADYGADPTDRKDDTDAFEKAIAKNIAVYVPAGVYYISRPLAFNNQNLFGDGEAATHIVGTVSDKNAPIIYVGGSSTVSMLSFSYDTGLVSGKEAKNERVAISCGASVGFGPGGGLEHISVSNAGTAVRSDNSDGFGCNNCCFEGVSLDKITFCGFDFTVNAGYGSVFRQIEMIDSTAKSVMTFKGSGGTDQVLQLSVRNCNLDYAIGYEQLSGVIFEEPVIEKCKLAQQSCVILKE